MTRTRKEINEIKIKFLDYLTAEPSITNAELCRRCGITPPTAQRYRKHFMDMVDQQTMKIAKEIEEKTKDDGSILLIVKKWLKIK